MADYDYGFEYFCGANVTVRIKGIPVLEAAGISVSIQESKFPLYGYSSRHYDAIARGRVLVNGTLAINLVHHDYLPQLIRYAYGISNGDPVDSSQTQMNLDIFNALTASEEIVDEQIIVGLAEKLQQAIWDSQSDPENRYTKRSNPIDNYNGIEIEIVAGDQDFGNKINGLTSVVIQDVHFTGKSFSVEASEQVIYELHSFIARNVLTLKNTQLKETTTSDGTVTIDEANITVSDDPFDPQRVNETFIDGETD